MDMQPIFCLFSDGKGIGFNYDMRDMKFVERLSKIFAVDAIPDDDDVIVQGFPLLGA